MEGVGVDVVLVEMSEVSVEEVEDVLDVRDDETEVGTL